MLLKARARTMMSQFLASMSSGRETREEEFNSGITRRKLHESRQGNEWTKVLLHARQTYQSSLYIIWALESSKYALYEANAWPPACHVEAVLSLENVNEISMSTPDAHVFVSNQQWITTPNQAYPSVLVAQPTLQNTLSSHKWLVEWHGLVGAPNRFCGTPFDQGQEIVDSLKPHVTTMHGCSVHLSLH
ncbi:hypothetical protein VNO77_25983 [Canavalia gladiata]|uniref:Uncharacterized protein n=1 Tax=Canavalia gladiata TaxID=3824 RepID=A0AAN9Q311_CANGL